MSTAEKEKQRNEQVEDDDDDDDDDDEADEWCDGRYSKPGIPADRYRDKRIFSTGCSGVFNTRTLVSTS